MYIKIDSTGRVTAASMTHHCGDGEIMADLPEGASLGAMHDYRFVDGAWLYDPLPVIAPEVKPTAEERIATLEAQLASYEAAYREGVEEA